ncbi:MAG TPA: Ger(x)C family spore germination protein [Syntrophomonadaceae bacterium]|nr:Ger(x)C family spore germination protein [Syntrophomonadaceae bacterium]
MKTKQNNRILILAILLIIFSGFISGCWDSRELNQLGISSGVSFDIDPKTGDKLMAYQTIIPSKVRSSGGSSGAGGEQTGGGMTPAVFLYHTRGKTWNDALGNYYTHGDRIQFYPDDLLNICGEELAKQGLYSVIQTILRFPETRPNSYIMVARGKGSDILEVQDGIETVQGIGVAKQIRLAASFTHYPEVTILDFSNRLISKTTAPICPILGVHEDTQVNGQKIKNVNIVGTAVFKGDKMIGELNKQESRGFLWVINKVKKGFIAADSPDGSGKINLSIIRAKSKIKPELIDGNINFIVEITEEGNLTEYNGKQNLTDKLIKQIEKSEAKQIESDVRAAIDKSFKLNADVFGFGEAVHRKDKKIWKDLVSRWDEIYPDINIQIKVKTHINEVGDINRAIIPQQ